MALGQIKAFFAEISSLIRLQDLSKFITFYAEDSFSYLTMEGYVTGLLKTNNSLAYITSDLNDPLFAAENPNLHLVGLNKLAGFALSKTTAPVLVMTMPDLGSLHVARPSPKTRLVYVFHALVSTHRQYRTDAFDHYDHFFCCGHYHIDELRRRFEIIKKPCPKLHEVGYYKLDRLHKAYLTHKKIWSERQTILIAPSWHESNLLESIGSKIVANLLAKDFQVVVRPHPAFFTSIYPKGRSIIAQLKNSFSEHPNFLLDTAMNSELYFYEADLLITDWSGSAYEYAFGTERPVLFFETPPKVINEHWTNYGIIPFEVNMRGKVGQSLPLSKVESTAQIASEMLEQQALYRQELIDLRQREVFNFGSSAQVGITILKQVFEEASSSP